MSGRQLLLFPDPRPLVERLGSEFFRTLPEGPGVYLMRDAADSVLYVGKAKSLRHRLGAYRVANPDRLPRRQLRLLRAVARIEWQECDDEQAALAHESRLLRTLQPRFNRAGVWPGTPHFLAWRITDATVELVTTTTPEADAGWRFFGPLGSRAGALAALLSRVIGFALHPEVGVEALPMNGQRAGTIRTGGGADLAGLDPLLEALGAGETEGFVAWVRARRPAEAHPFERVWLEAELEAVSDWFRATRKETQIDPGP